MCLLLKNYVPIRRRSPEITGFGSSGDGIPPYRQADTALPQSKEGGPSPLVSSLIYLSFSPRTTHPAFPNLVREGENRLVCCNTTTKGGTNEFPDPPTLPASFHPFRDIFSISRHPATDAFPQRRKSKKINFEFSNPPPNPPSLPTRKPAAPASGVESRFLLDRFFRHEGKRNKFPEK